MKKTIEVSKVVAENLQASGAGAFPWESILELIMTLLGGNCFARQNLASYAQEVKKTDDVGIVKKIAALVVIRREMGVRRSEAKAIRDEMFATIDVMNDEELQTIEKEVNKELLPSEFVI